LLFAAILLGAVCAAITHQEQHEFNQFVKKFDRHYSSPAETHRRRDIFVSNLRRIHKVNAENRSYWLGVNEFTDMTFAEFSAARLMAPQDCSATDTNYEFTGIAPPTAVDWRDKGVVTEVKDQGNCGSCWTFSTTGAVESAWAIAKGLSNDSLVTLSEQQLVDCAQAFGNQGCNGGLPGQAFQYIIANQGLDTEEAYPYEGSDNSCRFVQSGIGATLANQVNITQDDEGAIVDAVANLGPVSVCFDVAGDFQMYEGGIYSSTECGSDPKSVNHAVLAVGFNVDSDQGTKYWIIKNSWGPTWGINGYFWMVRDQNMCGVATCASYPIINA